VKLEFFRHIFEKYSYVKFHGNPSSESRIVPCGLKDGRTDSLDKANSSIFEILRTRQKTVTYV